MNILEKEFVPYEPSLALKKLGFDEPCFTFYNGKFIQSTEFDFDSYNSIDVGHHPLAPTFSQAFRWFREKYSLYHNIKMFGDWDKPQFSYIISGRTMTNPAHMWHYEDKNSYEEAELACLIKLIEIVKNK